jgi:hypothetical protein
MPEKTKPKHLAPSTSSPGQHPPRTCAVLSKDEYPAVVEQDVAPTYLEQSNCAYGLRTNPYSLSKPLSPGAEAQCNYMRRSARNSHAGRTFVVTKPHIQLFAVACSVAMMLSLLARWSPHCTATDAFVYGANL